MPVFVYCICTLVYIISLTKIEIKLVDRIDSQNLLKAVLSGKVIYTQ